MNSAGQNEHSKSNVRHLVGKSSSEHTQQNIPLTSIRGRSSRSPPPRMRLEGEQPAGSSGAWSANPSPLGTVGTRGVGDAALLLASDSPRSPLFPSVKDGANNAPTQPSARQTASSTTVRSDQRGRPRRIVVKQEEFDLASVLFSWPGTATTPSSVKKRNKHVKRPPDRSQSSHEIGPGERPCEITKIDRNSKKVTFRKEIEEIGVVVDDHKGIRNSPAAGVKKSTGSPEGILTTRNSQIDEFIRKPSRDFASECSPESPETGETASPAEPYDGVDIITTGCQSIPEQLAGDLCDGGKEHDVTGRSFTCDGQGLNNTDDTASDDTSQVRLNEQIGTAMLGSSKVTSEQLHQKLLDRGAEIDDKTTVNDTSVMSKMTASVVVGEGERDKSPILRHINHDTQVGMAVEADGIWEKSADLQMERSKGNPLMISSRSAETASQATLNDSYHSSTVGVRTDEDGLGPGEERSSGEAKCNDNKALIIGATDKQVSIDEIPSCDYKDSATTISVDGATCSHAKDTASHDQGNDKDLITDQILRCASQSDCVETVTDVQPSEVLGTLSQVDAPEEKNFNAEDTGINSATDETPNSKPSDRENIPTPDGCFRSENAEKPKNDGPNQGISPPDVRETSQEMTPAAKSTSGISGKSTICISGESALSVTSSAKSSPECGIRQTFSSTVTGCPLMGSLAAASSELIGSSCDGENGGHKLVEKLLTPKSTAVTSSNGNATAVSPKSLAEILTTYCSYSSAHSTSTCQYVATGVATDRLLSPSYFQRSKVHSAQSSAMSIHPANNQSQTSSVPKPRTISAPASVNKAFIGGKPQVLFVPGNRQAVLQQQGSLGSTVWPTSTAACAQCTPQQLAHQSELMRSWQQTQTTLAAHCQPTGISSCNQALPSRNVQGVLGHQVAFPGWQGRFQVIRFQQPSAVVPCNVQPTHYVIYKDTVPAASASSKPQLPSAPPTTPPIAPPILNAPVTLRLPQQVTATLPTALPILHKPGTHRVSQPVAAALPTAPQIVNAPVTDRVPQPVTSALPTAPTILNAPVTLRLPQKATATLPTTLPTALPILHKPVTHRMPQPVTQTLPGYRFHLVPQDFPPPPPPVLPNQSPNDRLPPPPPPPSGTPKQSPNARTIQYQAPLKVASSRMQPSSTRSHTKPVPASVIPNGTLFIQTSKGLVKLEQQFKVNQAPSVTVKHQLLQKRTEGKASAVVAQNQSNSSGDKTSRLTEDLPSRPGRSQAQKPISKALTLHMKPDQTTGIRLPFQMLSQKHLLYLTSKNTSQQLDGAQKITVHPGFEKSGTQRGAEVNDSKTSQNSFEGNQQPDGYKKKASERSVELPETKSAKSTDETRDDGFAKIKIGGNISVEGVQERSENAKCQDDTCWKMSKTDMDSESKLSDSDVRETQASSEVISLHSSSDETQSDDTASSHKEDYTDFKTTSDDDDIKDEWRPSVPVKIPSKCTRRFRNPLTGGLSKINIRTSARRSSGGKGSSEKKGRRSTRMNHSYHGETSKTNPCKMDGVKGKGRKDSRKQPPCIKDASSPTKITDLDLKSKGETSDDDKHPNNTRMPTKYISAELAHQVVDDESSLSSRPSSASSFEDNVPHKTMAHKTQLDSSIKTTTPVKKGNLLEYSPARPNSTSELSENRTSSPSKRYHLRTTPSRGSDSDTLSSKYPKRVNSDDMNSDSPSTIENATWESAPLGQARRYLGRMQDGKNPSSRAPLWQKVLKMLGLRRKKPERQTPPGGTPWHKRRSSSVVLAESLAESAKCLETAKKEAKNDIDGKKNLDKAGNLKTKNSNQTSKNEKQSIKIKDSGGTPAPKKKGKQKAAKKHHKRRKLVKKAKVSPQSLSDPTSGSLTSIDFDSKRQTRSRTRPQRECHSVSSSQIDNASSPSSIRRGRKTLASISAQTWEDCYRCTYLKWKETKISPENLATDEGFKVMTNELGTPRAGPSKDKMSFQKLLISKWEDIVQSAQTGSLGECGSETHERDSPVNTRGLAYVETPPVAAEFIVCTSDLEDHVHQEVQNDFPWMSSTSDRDIDADFGSSGNGMEEAQGVQITSDTGTRYFTEAPEQAVCIDSYEKPPVLSPIQDLPIEPIDQTAESAERIETVEDAKAAGFIIPEMLTEDTLRLLAESGNIDSDLSGVQAFALFMPDTRENSRGEPVSSSPSPQPISSCSDYDNSEVPPFISCHRLNSLDDDESEAGEIDVGEGHKENECQSDLFDISSVPSAQGSDKTEIMHELDKSPKLYLPGQMGQEQEGLSQDETCLPTDVMPSASSHQDTRAEDEELRCTVLQKMDSSTASLEEGEIIDE